MIFVIVCLLSSFPIYLIILVSDLCGTLLWRRQWQWDPSIHPSIQGEICLWMVEGRYLQYWIFVQLSSKSKVEIDLTSKSTQMYRQMFTGQLAAALHFTQKVAVILSHLLLVFVTWRVVVGCKSYIIQGRYGAQWEIGAPSFLQNSPYVVHTYCTSQTVQ